MVKYDMLRKGTKFGEYELLQDLPLVYEEAESEKDGETIEKCFYVKEIQEDVHNHYNDGTSSWDSTPVEGWGFSKTEAYSELCRIIELVLERNEMSKTSMSYFKKVD